MSDLQTLLDAIKLDKDTNLTPETLKDGVTCLGVEGETKPLSITEDATATSNDMAAGVTAYINNEKVEGALETISTYTVSGGDITTTYDENSSRVIVSSTENTRGIFDNITITQKVDQSDIADAVDLTPEKILEGNTILGITGTAKSLDITNDATATADDILAPKTAYINGEKVTGTIYGERHIQNVWHDDDPWGDGSIYTNSMNNVPMFNISSHFKMGDEDMKMLIEAKADGTGTVIQTAAPISEVVTAIELAPEKLVEGNTVLGVVGTTKPLSVTSDATATANDIMSGKTAYVNGEKVEGALVAEEYNDFYDVEVADSTIGDITYLTLGLPAGSIEETKVVNHTSNITLSAKYEDVANYIGLTPDLILEGNVIMGIEGTGKSGAIIFNSVDELGFFIGGENEVAVVIAEDGTYNGTYRFNGTQWVEIFSDRRYEGTIPPAEYDIALETALNIQGG